MCTSFVRWCNGNSSFWIDSVIGNSLFFFFLSFFVFFFFLSDDLLVRPLNNKNNTLEIMETLTHGTNVLLLSFKLNFFI